MQKTLALLTAFILIVAASSIFACPGSKNKGDKKESTTKTETIKKA